MNQEVRTRFAPSPTGYMHVGGVRTALFAWLLAQKHGGKFMLRIEDTDQARMVEGSMAHIIESLDWLGLNWDEGPILQSERVAQGLYKDWAQKLIDMGRAYADPYTAEQVQAFREEAQSQKRPFLYRNHRPESPAAWDGTTPLRFLSDPKSYEAKDLVMGQFTTSAEVIDDFILIKSDGYPTYNFAHIVDDLDMDISHVIRGQEFLASLPNYLNLHEALDAMPPIFVTVPHIMGPTGAKKLSKRDGAKDLLEYKREGYLPEAMVNFLATLGWNDGTEQEIFSIPELIEKFDLGRIQKGGARFDEQRLLWINGTYIRSLDTDTVYQDAHGFWPQSAQDYPEDYKREVITLVQERLKYFAELPELTNFFFEDLPVDPELISSHKQLKKLNTQELKTLLQAARDKLASITFEHDALQNALNQLLEETNQKPAVLFSLIRIAITQSPASPGLAETLAVLGQEVSLKRLDTQLANF